MLLKGKKEQDRSVCKKHPQERQFNMFFFFTFFGNSCSVIVRVSVVLKRTVVGD